jgi:hypothetical protein
MPAGLETQVTALELERVEPKVTMLFERDDTFYSMIEKRPVDVISPRDMRILLELRPGGKPGHFNSDGGDLGRGDMPTYDKAVVNTVNLKFAMEWTTKRKWATDDSRKAVLNTLKRDLASSMKSFRRYVDSLCMTSGNGVLGTISSVSTASGVDTYTLNTDGFGARLMQYGWDIQVWDTNLAAPRTAADGSGTPITFIDYPNKQIKVAAVAGAVSTDKLVTTGLTSVPPVSLLGVPYHHSNASTGTWLGFDRATTPEIRANRVAAGGTLTLPMPRLAINKIGDRVGIDYRKKLKACMHPCQKQAYEELGFEVIRINKSAKEEGLDLYFNDNMSMAGAPVSVSYSWDKKRIDFVDLDVWGRAEFHPPGFYKDENGNRYFVVRGTSGGVATSNLAYLVASFNLFMNNPAAASYIDTLTVPSGY